MGESHRCSVHLAIGGGAVADVLLWKNWFGSAAVLIGSTALWLLSERAGYNLLSFISNALFLLVVILFFWAKSALLLNRPLPPVPNLDISEESVVKAADEMQVWVNRALSIAHDITIGGNLGLFFQVFLGLWMISYIGGFFNFLTLAYIAVLLSLSLPVFYAKYQRQIDEKLIIAHKIIQTQYRKIDEQILRKIPMLSNNDKKNQ
ncbi:reticulon-like protein B11 [Olea europaea var. sylvestris]|uniref:Reticulon-like protein n=1 Tax=Olea europaea subsp. europaea TaxID=158383 RepID=A0A8S0R3U3_OLEEU|nr:reticulon-like protein B11 [Olea europaea var. sylvestris]CAA2974070.1 reticulon B11 [Olea europaea subsp. europaea]